MKRSCGSSCDRRLVERSNYSIDTCAKLPKSRLYHSVEQIFRVLTHDRGCLKSNCLI